MATPPHPKTFVSQVATRVSQNLRMYWWENSRQVPTLHFFTDMKRVIKDKDRLIAIAVKFAVRIRKLMGGDERRCERSTIGFESVFG
jgi:hypothetical protein